MYTKIDHDPGYVAGKVGSMLDRVRENDADEPVTVKDFRDFLYAVDALAETVNALVLTNECLRRAEGHDD